KPWAAGFGHHCRSRRRPPCAGRHPSANKPAAHPAARCAGRPGILHATRCPPGGFHRRPIARAEAALKLNIMKRLLFPGLLLALLLALPGLAAAQATFPALTSTPGADGSQTWSFNVETLVMLTMLSFLPAMLLMMTGFTRIIIVLSLLRTA